jgi:hypothetical protein
MGKGLPRSMRAGQPARSAVVKATIPLRNVAVAVAGASGVGFGSAVIGDLPQGNILLLGAVAYLRISEIAGGDADVQDTFDGDVSIGTAPTADATLSGAEVDIIASTALGAATAGVSPLVRATNATQAILDNTDGSMELNLNVLIDDLNISGAGSLLANGSLHLAYTVLGDD